MDSVILIIILIALVEASFKHVDIFNEFIEGVKEGSKLLITLFPTMMAFTPVSYTHLTLPTKA